MSVADSDTLRPVQQWGYTSGGVKCSFRWQLAQMTAHFAISSITILDYH